MSIIHGNCFHPYATTSLSSPSFFFSSPSYHPKRPIPLTTIHPTINPPCVLLKAKGGGASRRKCACAQPFSTLTPIVRITSLSPLFFSIIHPAIQKKPNKKRQPSVQNNKKNQPPTNKSACATIPIGLRYLSGQDMPFASKNCPLRTARVNQNKLPPQDSAIEISSFRELNLVGTIQNRLMKQGSYFA